MKYEIKSYKEEFLEDQERIGTEETAKWRFAGQATKEQLKEIYSQPDFDPETRLYAFLEGKMVGFVTSSIKEEEKVKIGDMRVPFVAEGHEDARGALLEQAVEVLKDKGATKIQTPVSPFWGETIQFIEKYKFKHQTDTGYVCQKRLDEIDLKIEPVDVQAFDYQAHADIVAKLVAKQFEASDEEAKQVVDRYKDWKIGEAKSPFRFPQKLIFHLLVIENKEVIGRALGFQSENLGEKVVQFYAIYAKENNVKIIGQLLAAGIKESKKLEMEELLLLAGAEEKKLYTSHGLEFTTIVSMYEKEL
ncbi:MAG: hypothetical protein ACFFC7_02030 [Candidatus Hermodarchaeota archaeon]